MCGRYYINDETAKEIEKLIRQIDDALLASCKERDVYPSAKAPVILAGSEQSDQLTAGEFTWGFPSYSNKGVIFNARSETALEKKTFRESVKQRRCIIPATGFYEWSEQKDKYFFRAPDRHVLLFAGFYRHYEDGDRFPSQVSAPLSVPFRRPQKPFYPVSHNVQRQSSGKYWSSTFTSSPFTKMSQSNS